MKAIVYDGLQKVECRTVEDPGIEKEMYDKYILLYETMGIVGDELYTKFCMQQGLPH